MRRETVRTGARKAGHRELGCVPNKEPRKKGRQVRTQRGIRRVGGTHHCFVTGGGGEREQYVGERMRESFGGHKKGYEKCYWGLEVRLPFTSLRVANKDRN